MAKQVIEHVAIEALRPWARNARTDSKKQIRQIADSIRAFGFTNPVLIDGANTILAGHGRVAAAKLLDLRELPCVRLEAMTSDQKRAYVIADNKLALNAGWDEEGPGRGAEGAAHRRPPAQPRSVRRPRNPSKELNRARRRGAAACAPMP